MVFQSTRIKRTETIAKKLGVENEGGELWSGPVKVGRVVPGEDGKFIIFSGGFSHILECTAKTFAVNVGVCDRSLYDN